MIQFVSQALSLVGIAVFAAVVFFSGFALSNLVGYFCRERLGQFRYPWGLIIGGLVGMSFQGVTDNLTGLIIGAIAAAGFYARMGWEWMLMQHPEYQERYGR